MADEDTTCKHALLNGPGGPISGFGFRNMKPGAIAAVTPSHNQEQPFCGGNYEDLCGLYSCRFDGNLTQGE